MSRRTSGGSPNNLVFAFWAYEESRQLRMSMPPIATDLCARGSKVKSATQVLSRLSQMLKAVRLCCKKRLMIICLCGRKADDSAQCCDVDDEKLVGKGRRLAMPSQVQGCRCSMIDLTMAQEKFEERKCGAEC